MFISSDIVFLCDDVEDLARNIIKTKIGQQYYLVCQDLRKNKEIQKKLTELEKLSNLINESIEVTSESDSLVSLFLELKREIDDEELVRRFRRLERQFNVLVENIINNLCRSSTVALDKKQKEGMNSICKACNTCPRDCLK